MAQKIRVFNAPVLENETSLRRGVPKAFRIWHSGSLQLKPPRCYEALCCRVECLAAMYPRLHCYSSLCFFSSVLLFYCLASFFILISTCPIKKIILWGISAILVNMDVSHAI